MSAINIRIDKTIFTNVDHKLELRGSIKISEKRTFKFSFTSSDCCSNFVILSDSDKKSAEISKDMQKQIETYILMYAYGVMNRTSFEVACDASESEYLLEE